MTKYERIEKLIENLFGEIGHKKGQFAYESWLNHHAVVEMVNDAGGCRNIISEYTPTALLRTLENMAKYKRFMNN